MGTCHLFIFIDAMGAAITGKHAVMRDTLPYFRPLRSVFGYSSACVPSILTGRYPEEHGHWSYFTHTGAGQGLRMPWWVKCLPGGLRDRGRVRRHLSRAVARHNDIQGYFQLYQLPIANAGDYGHCEPRNIFTPGGINHGRSIIDDLADAQMLGTRSCYISDWHQDAEHNWATMTDAVRDPECRFALMYDAHLDGWLHTHTKEHAGLPERLAAIRANIQQAWSAAAETHDDVKVYVFSDHGMCTVTDHRNVMPVLDQTGLRMHRDYHMIIDSTMVRALPRFPAPRADTRCACSGCWPASS